MKYEDSVKGSSLYEIQSSVRKELNELKTVSLDMSMVGSNRLTFSATDNMIKKKEESYNFHNNNNNNPIINTTTTTTIVNDNIEKEKEKYIKLSRLILAEEQINSTNKGNISKSDSMDCTTDIVMSCVTENILNNAFEIYQNNSDLIDNNTIQNKKEISK